MNPDSPKKTASLSRWIIPASVVLFFVGARQLHPGGILGLIGDALTEPSSNSKTEQLRDSLLRSLIPIGASAICMETFSENADIEAAAVAYNARNESEMKSLVAKIEALGGMSKDEKHLLDRKAYRAARELLNMGHGANENCKALPDRINAGEFDL